MRVAIYTRISQDREGKEVGVENQENTCRAIAEDLGATVVTVYRDNDRGASSRTKKTRPDFERMMKDAAAGKYDFIVAYSMSRLTRRPREWEDLIQLAEKRSLKYRFKVSPTYDLTTADGRATARTVAAWDAAEAERTGERVQHAIQAKLIKGEDMGGPRPFGYSRDRKRIIKKEADALRWAYGQVLAGKSLVSIAREFTARGLKRDRAQGNSWRPQTIRNMLLRPRNIGHLEIKGTLYATNLPAIIDADTHEAVRAILTNPDRRPLRGRVPVTQSLTGLLKCGVCGNYLRLASSRGQTYLKCAPDGRPIATQGLKHPTMLLASAEAEVFELVRNRLVALIVTDTEFSTTKPTKDIQLELAEYRRRRDLAQEMMYEPGANVPRLKADIAAFGVEIDRLQVEYDQAVSADIGGSALDAALVFVHTEHGSAQAWKAYWSALEVTQRRALIRALLPSARLLRAGAEKRITADELPALAAYTPMQIAEIGAQKWLAYQVAKVTAYEGGKVTG